MAGREGYWRWYLETYEAERSKGYVDPVSVALAYAQLGDADAAFRLLDEGSEMRSGDLMWLNVDPSWDPIRGDPRFADLLRRINYPGS